MMDDICQEQFMEMSYLNGGQEHGARVRGGPPVRGRGVPPAGAHRCGYGHMKGFSYSSCWVTEEIQRHYYYIYVAMKMLSSIVFTPFSVFM